MMPFFGNHSMEIWDYKSSSTDEYGVVNKYTLNSVITVDLQPLSHADTMKNSGSLIEDTMKIYCSVNAPITSTSILRFVGETNTYKVIGNPEKNNHVLSHMKVEIQLQQTPTVLG